MRNDLTLALTKKRWTRRIFRSFFPKTAKVNIYEDLCIYINPKVLHGPSHDISFGRKNAFENYEYEDKNELLSFLEEGDCFVDIGANIGLFSLFVAYHRPGVIIDAYEPQSENYHCLSSSIQENGFGQVQAFQKAIGAEEREGLLYVSNKNDGGHSMTLNSAEKSEERIEKVFVEPLKRPRRNGQERKIKLIKIDVEGFEQAVLEGCLQILKEDRPILVIECTNQDILDNSGTYKLLTENFGDKMKAKVPGSDWRSLKELRVFAEEKASRGEVFSNYFFSL